MHDTKQKKVPSRLWLRSLITFGFTVYILGGLAGVVVLCGWLVHKMNPSQNLPTWVHPFILTWPVSIIFIIGGPTLAILSSRRLKKYYHMIVDGVVVEVGYEGSSGVSSYLYARVRGSNRAGRNLEQKVPVNPDRWKTLKFGDRYPWTS